MKKWIFLTSTFLLTNGFLFAQNDDVVVVRDGRDPTLSGGIQLAVPTGEFADNYEGNPFGIYAGISFPLLELPIEVGGTFVWNRLSQAGENVTIQNSLNPQRNRGTLEVNGNAYTYQLHGRLRPFDGKFRPYGELYAGVRNFSITSELQLKNVAQASGDLVERDFTFVAGYAIGAKFQLVEGIFLEARFDSQTGSEATYIDPESVRIKDDGSFTYETQQSRTNQWALSLGIAFSF